MNNKITYVLGKICEETLPGKKTVQKLLYLLERQGLDLGLDYTIHFYGPYSADLDHILHVMESNNLISINTSGMTHTIKMPKKQRTNPLDEVENDALNNVLNIFLNKPALELELITTTDYAATEMIKRPELSREGIISLVNKIKGDKFSEAQISDSIEILTQHGFLKI